MEIIRKGKVIKITPKQIETMQNMKAMLETRNLTYLAGEMRTGKTYMSLNVAKELSTNILFITLKSALQDVEAEVVAQGISSLTKVVNFESLHKIKNQKFSLVIVDEAHSLGAYPHPSKRVIKIKELCSNVKYVIYLSGTPSPESYSQLYHQFAVLPNSISPIRNYKNFYEFAREHVQKKIKMIDNARSVNDYSFCKQSGINLFEPFFLRLSQEEAGFKKTGVDEEFIYCNSIHTTELIYRITRDKMLKINDTEIICKNAADVFTKVHQISSGTILCESGAFILSLHKVQELKKLLTNGKRCVIFTKFVAEEKLLLESKYKIEEATGNIDDFQQGRAKHFISNVAKASMGVNLSMADIIVFYNLDFSSKNFIQAKARLQAYAKEEKTKIVYLFTIGGLEEKIYKSLKKKESYTLSYFKRDFQCYDRKPVTIEDY